MGDYEEALIRLGEAFRESAKVLEETGKVPEFQIEGGPDGCKFMVVAIAEILRQSQERADEIIRLAAGLKAAREQDNVHWKTWRHLLAERDAALADLEKLREAAGAAVADALKGKPFANDLAIVLAAIAASREKRR